MDRKIWQIWIEDLKVRRSQKEIRRWNASVVGSCFLCTLTPQKYPSTYLHRSKWSEETGWELRTIEKPSFIRLYKNFDFFLNFPEFSLQYSSSMAVTQYFPVPQHYNKPSMEPVSKIVPNEPYLLVFSLCVAFSHIESGWVCVTSRIWHRW